MLNRDVVAEQRKPSGVKDQRLTSSFSKQVFSPKAYKAKRTKCQAPHPRYLGCHLSQRSWGRSNGAFSDIREGAALLLGSRPKSHPLPELAALAPTSPSFAGRGSTGWPNDSCPTAQLFPQRPLHILCQDIRFQVHLIANLQATQGGIAKRMRNQRHAKELVVCIHQG